MEKINTALAANSLESNKLQNSYQQDKNLTLNSQQLAASVRELPVQIADSWVPCVVGHIQHFGLGQVRAWAKRAAGKNNPERYFMTILRQERYGK